MRLIDADALILELNNSHYPGAPYVDAGINIAIGKVCEALTIDAVSTVHGEWILLEPRYPIEQKVYWSKEQAIADTKGNGARERRKCSCCGYTKSFMCHMKDEQIKLWNFCPNCGAKMKGVDDETEIS